MKRSNHLPYFTSVMQNISHKQPDKNDEIIGFCAISERKVTQEPIRDGVRKVFVDINQRHNHKYCVINRFFQTSVSQTLQRNKQTLYNRLLNLTVCLYTSLHFSTRRVVCDTLFQTSSKIIARPKYTKNDKLQRYVDYFDPI